MKNKLPVVGQTYRSSIKHMEEIILVSDANCKHISYKYDLGDGDFSMEYAIPVAEFWDHFEELPSATKENYTCSLEVQAALEELKERLSFNHHPFCDKLFSSAQNLVNALESKENK
jgi:hypothetical protein